MLTKRQSELMDLLVAHPGWTDKRLAYAMTVSESRIGQLLGEVFRAYDVDSRDAARAKHQYHRLPLTKRYLSRPHRRVRLAPGQVELL